MARSETLTVDLAPDTAGLVQEAVRSGEFANASELIEAAVRGWNAGRDLLGYSPEEIRRLADEGFASGPGTLSSDDIKRKALRRAGVSDAQE